jgi:hypothetical protein
LRDTLPYGHDVAGENAGVHVGRQFRGVDVGLNLLGDHLADVVAALPQVLGDVLGLRVVVGGTADDQAAVWSVGQGLLAAAA